MGWIWRWRKLLAVNVVGLVALAALIVADVGWSHEVAAPPTGAPRYIDPTAGDDTAEGDLLHPWRSFAPLAGAVLGPGSSVSIRSGSTLPGPVELRGAGTAARPAVLTSYGDGPAPVITLPEGARDSCVVLNGSWLRVTQLHARGCGWAGFEIIGDDITVADSESDGSVSGVAVAESSHRATVTHNVVHDNDKMSVLTPEPTDDDSGAFGIAVLGRDAMVTDNTISGCHAFSYDFGTDGSGIEVYNATGSLIARNRIDDCQSGIELGGTASEGTLFAYNVVSNAAPGATGIVTRGTGARFGPVRGTEIVNNTVLLTGTGSTGLTCDGECGSGIVTITNNVVSAPVAVYGGGAAMDYCILFGDRHQVALGRHVSLLSAPWTDRGQAPPGAVGQGTTSLPARDKAARPATVSANQAPSIGAVG